MRAEGHTMLATLNAPSCHVYCCDTHEQPRVCSRALTPRCCFPARCWIFLPAFGALCGADVLLRPFAVIQLLAAIANNDREVPPSMLYAAAAILEGCSFVNGGSQNTMCGALTKLAEVTIDGTCRCLSGCRHRRTHYHYRALPFESSGSCFVHMLHLGMDVWYNSTIFPPCARCHTLTFDKSRACPFVR